MADRGPPFDIALAETLKGVPHGFFGSAGGSHQFGYGGPGAVKDTCQLRALAAAAIRAGGALAAPHQVHSCDVITVTETWSDEAEGRPVGDALVTDRKDIVLAIVTADCAPVLFADRGAGVVGAAHAGWRGAVGEKQGDVLANCLQAMEALGAKRANISAAIGPTIGQASYEVDSAFRANFSESDESCFNPAPMREGIERWHFDLPGYIERKLRSYGVAEVTDIALDTYPLAESDHSYRREVQNNQANYGRNISMIANF